VSTAPADTAPLLTPPQVARRLQCTPEKVLRWIRTGSLRAVNLGDGPKRPRFRIDPAELDRFLVSREVSPRPRPVRRRRDSGIKHYFRSQG